MFMRKTATIRGNKTIKVKILTSEVVENGDFYVFDSNLRSCTKIDFAHDTTHKGKTALEWKNLHSNIIILRACKKIG